MKNISGVTKVLKITVLVGVASTFLAAQFTQNLYALVGAHSYTNGSTGDVFLGGDYIEVGISERGSFGTTSGELLPEGFYGTASRANVGMSSNPAGFGELPDLRIDFFLPGTPEERWIVGYRIDGDTSIGNSSLLMGQNDIPDNTVTNQSSGNKLQATSVGTFNDNLKTTQVVSFDEDDKYFKNEVTLENVGSDTLDDVRYMRNFDPDNTADQGGASSTRNQILFTHEAGDEKAVVMADTSNNPSDPVFAANGSRSPILFYSNYERARVSTFGFSNSNPYAASAYDSALPKGTVTNTDTAISITADVGTLEPNESETFVYYTSLDNRDFSEVIEDIEEDNEEPEESSDNDNISATEENAGPNNGDGNNDGTSDSEQSNVASYINNVVGGGAYQTLQSEGCDIITSVAVNKENVYGKDSDYKYPLGLTDFTLECLDPGDTTTVTIYYDDLYDDTDWVARKYIDGSFTTIPGAVFGSANVGSRTVTTLMYDITDGGPLDADGLANGVIVDPAGAAAQENPIAPNTGLKPASNLARNVVGVLFVLAGAFILFTFRRQQKQ